MENSNNVTYNNQKWQITGGWVVNIGLIILLHLNVMYYCIPKIILNAF